MRPIKYLLECAVVFSLLGQALAFAQAPPSTAIAVVSWAYANANQDGFLVMRSTDGAPTTQVGSVGKEARQFTESVPLGALHCYVVIAHNAAGQAAPSTPPACARKDVIPMPAALLPVSSVTIIFQ